MNILDKETGLRIIEEINGDENKQRKLLSFKQSNMQNDNFYQYVSEWLEHRYKESVKDMSVIASVNLQRRISKQEASIYKRSPERTFSNLTEEQEAVIETIYNDGKFDTQLNRSNENFKYQQQSCLQVVPVDGKIELRVLKNHHYDVVPDPKNPEKPLAYIVSNFDYTDNDQVNRYDRASGRSQGNTYRDGTNQRIGDVDDPKTDRQIFYIWTTQYHFVVDESFNYLDKVTLEPLATVDDNYFISPLAEYGVMPFIDIASDKEFEFWVRSGNALFDATITYNSILSNENKVVDLQGHAQAFYKGSAEHLPENLQVGPTTIIHIPVDPNNPVDSEFGFVSPNADLASIRDFRESYLNSFLSSRGIDASTVSGSPQATAATSGVDRLLQMIERFEASEEDMALYQSVETKLYNIVTAWIKVLNGARDVNGNPLLDDKYITALPEETEVMVSFAKPQKDKSDVETMDMIERKMSLGLYSRVDALMELENLDKEEAQRRAIEIDTEDVVNGNAKAEILEEGSEPDIQPEEAPR